MVWTLLAASEAAMAYKQPRRLDLTFEVTSMHIKPCLFGLFRLSLEVSKMIKKDELASTRPVGFTAGKKEFCS